MTTIPADIHAQLTASERIRAAVSAQSRGDTEEIRNLTETAPRKLYQVADPQYCDGLARLVSLALAVESDLQGHALDFMMATLLELAAGEADAVQVEAITAAMLEYFQPDKQD